MLQNNGGFNMSTNENSELMLDVALAAELKSGFRRNGWTKADIKELTKKDTLGKVLSFLNENKNQLVEINAKEKKSKKERCTSDAKLLDSQSEEASEDLMLMDQELKLDMEKVLSRLNVDEVCILRLYFGINCDPHSIEEIAEQQNMTAKKVAFMMNGAINHIRQLKVFRHLLKEYLNPPKVFRV